ncbi:MAG: ribonuclease HII [Thaumarchaeota archaeon]|nr:ribonuclease HII [Nitrososphaerota archaeon]
MYSRIFPSLCSCTPYLVNHRISHSPEMYSSAMLCGIDEAGRGAIIGPLVVAGVVFKREAIEGLLELGVKDSKALTPAKRSQLAAEITDRAVRVTTLELSPGDIDQVVTNGRRNRKLNYAEAGVMARVIDHLYPDTAYVDACDVNEDKYSSMIFGFMKRHAKVISFHHADRTNVLVSAASIIAKVSRDQRISRLQDIHGEFGSGYPSDRKTLRFLNKWVKKKNSIPDFARHSWSTWDSWKQTQVIDLRSFT